MEKMSTTRPQMASETSEPTIAEEELIVRTLGGDHRAFSDLYQQHANYIFGLIGRLVGPVSERDDLLQDTFVRFHQALPRFRGDSTVRTFIARIAVNRAHDHLRQRRRRQQQVYAQFYAHQLDAYQAHNRDARSVVSERLLALRCLEKISIKKRVAFVLRVACGMSYGELAELLNINPDTARQRVVHARREIKRHLSRDGMSS